MEGYWVGGGGEGGPRYLLWTGYWEVLPLPLCGVICYPQNRHQGGVQGGLSQQVVRRSVCWFLVANWGSRLVILAFIDPMARSSYDAAFRVNATLAEPIGK